MSIHISTTLRCCLLLILLDSCLYLPLPSIVIYLAIAIEFCFFL